MNIQSVSNPINPHLERRRREEKEDENARKEERRTSTSRSSDSIVVGGTSLSSSFSIDDDDDDERETTTVWRKRETLFLETFTRAVSLSLSLSLSKRVSRRRIPKGEETKHRSVFFCLAGASLTHLFFFFACFSLLLFLSCLFVSCGEREDTFCGSNEAKSTSFFFPLGFVLSFFVVTLTERTTREEEDQKQRATSTRKKRDKAPRVLFHCYSLFSSVTERLFDQKCSRTKRRRHHHHHRALSHRTSKKAWRRYAAFWRKKPPGRRA